MSSSNSNISVSESVESVNVALDDSNADKLLENMAGPELAIHSVIADCKEMYLEKLQEALNAKKSEGMYLSKSCISSIYSLLAL